MTTRSLLSTKSLSQLSGSSKTHFTGNAAPLRDEQSISPSDRTDHQGKPSLTNYTQALRTLEQTAALERHCYR
jgi:hypothetical protein